MKKINLKKEKLREARIVDASQDRIQSDLLKQKFWDSDSATESSLPLILAKITGLGSSLQELEHFYLIHQAYGY